MTEQLTLLEVRPAECAGLAQMHIRMERKCRRAAELFASRGFDTLARQEVQRARAHESEAECLAMFADFARLGGIR